MDRIDAHYLEGFHFTQGPGGSQLHDVRRAGAAKDDQRRDQGSQFANDHDHHDDSEKPRGSHAGEKRNRLTDHNQSKRKREEARHRKQEESRARDLLEDQRTDDSSCHAKLGEDDPQDDQSERSDCAQGVDHAYQAAPEINEVQLRKRHPVQ